MAKHRFVEQNLRVVMESAEKRRDSGQERQKLVIILCQFQLLSDKTITTITTNNSVLYGEREEG